MSSFGGARMKNTALAIKPARKRRRIMPIDDKKLKKALIKVHRKLKEAKKRVQAREKKAAYRVKRKTNIQKLKALKYNKRNKSKNTEEQKLKYKKYKKREKRYRHKLGIKKPMKKDYSLSHVAERQCCVKNLGDSYGVALNAKVFKTSAVRTRVLVALGLKKFLKPRQRGVKFNATENGELYYFYCFTGTKLQENDSPRLIQLFLGTADRTKVRVHGVALLKSRSHFRSVAQRGMLKKHKFNLTKLVRIRQLNHEEIREHFALKGGCGGYGQKKTQCM